jgi:hypothetical protein
VEGGAEVTPPKDPLPLGKRVGMSPYEVAAALGISVDRVLQIERRALAKLRKLPLAREMYFGVMPERE